MKKRITAFIVCVLLLTLSAPIEARQYAKSFRIGVLRPGSRPDLDINSFLLGLSELGYVENENVFLEYRYAEGKPERLADLAAELVRLKVDLIVASGDAALRSAKQATQTIPIVMLNHGDPVGSGLVASLARPGGNITGFSILSPELSGKALELLKETLPKLAWASYGTRPTQRRFLISKRPRVRPKHWESSFDHSRCANPVELRVHLVRSAAANRGFERAGRCRCNDGSPATNC